MSNLEAIDRWAKYIVPAVFKAEDELQKAVPQWKERLRKLGQPGGEDPHKVAEKYCREIATIIVVNSCDYDDEEWEEEEEDGDTIATQRTKGA